MTEQYKEQLKNAFLSSISKEAFERKNVLIAGSTGLIGGCLVDMLMQADIPDLMVYGIGRNTKRAKERFSDYIRKGKFQFITADTTQPLSEIDIPFHYIINAASGASPSAYSSDPIGVMKANIYGVDNLLDYGRKQHLERFVYVSSGEVYGEGGDETFTEDFSGYVNPATLRACYPSAKRAAETLTVCYAQQHGLHVSIARPCHVYGPYFNENDNRVYAQFIRNALKGEDIVMKSSGEQFRSWCYVVDCAVAILLILLKGENMTPYNIADAQSNITIKHLAEMIAGLNGQKVITEIPNEQERAGYSVVQRATFDTTRIEQLGWKINGSMIDKIGFTIKEVKSEKIR